MRRLVLLLVALAGGARPSWAQITDSLGGRPAFSIGQPTSWQPYVSAFGVIPDAGSNGLGALAGIHRPITNPIVGLFGVSGEALGEWRPGENGAGLRVLATAPVFGLGLGADWRPAGGNIATLLTFQTAIRRGGVFGHGSMIRVDWLPARRHTIDFGVQFPFLQPFAGRTRPRQTTVPAPKTSGDAIRRLRASRTLPDSAASALRIVADAAPLISTYVTLYSSADEAALAAGASRRYGHSFDATTRAYIAALASAFRAATADSIHGDATAARARAIALDDVILPFDGLFGQVKDDEVLTGMLALSHSQFAQWIRDSSGIATDKHAAVLAVYDRWLDILSEVAARARKAWKDSRLVWLPAQLALATDQYDEQSEVDALIGRAVGHAFTDSNSLGYLRTADLTVEIARSIIAARTYHVLWTHDFTGRRLTGELDQVAYTMVADAYLPALTAAVQRYDTSGTMPQYFILLDAFYYHARAATIWMSILENPLHAAVHLRASEWREAVHLRDRLDALRSAVARSRRLQRESAAHGGSWLAKVVKVNVNITQPSDFSFRSAHLVPPIPFTPDNVARDHRKFVLYDLTEADPYAGELLVTGIGVGEHYASNTWEDRGYRLRGPAAVEARDATRRELLANGLRPDQIPEPLRVARGVGPPSSQPRDVARVLQVHNEPGFGAKQSSVARAMLYSLAPPGSIIIVPDPLWLSASWAGMLAGAAARGSSVMFIAPARANAPSPEPPVIALEREILNRMLAIRHRLAAGPNESYGTLHVGVYASTAPITDVAGRIREVRDGLSRSPWIRDLIPFDSTALSVLTQATAQADRSDTAATNIAQDIAPRAPQLHQKTQLIARPGAMAALVRQPGWASVLAQTIRTQARQTARLADAIGAPLPPADTAAIRAADARLQGYERTLSAADRRRLTFYFELGTQNHDPRGLMLDGETSIIVSGFDASTGLVDLFFLMARTTWIEREAEVDQLVPAPSRLMSRLGRLVRVAM